MAAPRLFGTNGIRGVVGSSIDANFAYKLGSSVASLFYGKTILIGRDGRTSSRMLTEAVVAGILAQGNGVHDCGEITTPGLQFLVKLSAGMAGVMITASHNPPEYNGFKVVDLDGVEIARDKEERIERMIASKSPTLSKNPGQRTSPPEPVEPYLSNVMSYVSGKKVSASMTVVVDTGNGVGALTTPVLLRRLGCRVVTINDNIDGRFPGRTSEPRPENLGPLATTVKEEKAAFGVAHDGDGDRAIFVDDAGVIHSGDESLTLIEDEVLGKTPGGKVVTPVNSSMSVAEVAKKRKGKLILTPVGSINVARTMMREKAILGGEENGGIFYMPHQPVRDGAMATVLILNSILENKMSLSKLMGRLPRFFMAKQKRTCDDKKKAEVMRKIRQKLGNKVTSTIDGVRVDLKNRGWFLVRASGTEPLVRTYVEGKTEKDLNELLDEFNPMFDQMIGA
ncbi:MAG TPA: phosphoglucosamine mutase [Candidatus Dormibacteraeota bacterium]|nr:phosphoglucosamine mutase [Candidatus Dormibacteraeota bacterium]